MIARGIETTNDAHRASEDLKEEKLKAGRPPALAGDRSQTGVKPRSRFQIRRIALTNQIRNGQRDPADENDRMNRMRMNDTWARCCRNTNPPACGNKPAKGA